MLSNLYHKKDDWKCFIPYNAVGSKTAMDPIDFHCMDKDSWNIFQNIFLFYRRKKNHTGLEQNKCE